MSLDRSLCESPYIPMYIIVSIDLETECKSWRDNNLVDAC
jgi:hypothetical protein